MRKVKYFMKLDGICLLQRKKVRCLNQPVVLRRYFGPDTGRLVCVARNAKEVAPDVLHLICRSYKGDTVELTILELCTGNEDRP
jgi:hypothetical protein